MSVPAMNGKPKEKRYSQDITPRERLLKETILRQSRDIEDLKKELKRIASKANKLVNGQAGGSSSESEGDNEETDSEGEENIIKEEQGEEREETTLWWDDQDDIYRCNGCGWEVVEGTCQACGDEYEHDGWDVHHDPYGSISTDDCTLVSDRLQTPRGTTPLLELEDIVVPEPIRASGRAEEFLSLLHRGATSAMCERYQLKYSHQGGIIATADEALKEIFAGPSIDSDEWTIHLGRCFDLEDNDIDGTQFLQDLLEEVLYFPVRSEHSECVWDRWETVQTDDGWVTRPILDRFKDSDSDDDEWDIEDDAAVSMRVTQSADRALDDGIEEEAIQPDEYEATDDEDDNAPNSDPDSDSDMEDMDWTFQAGVPDTVYESDVEMEDELEEECSDGGVVVKAENEPQDPYDSADSDFDSSEELSGDEEVIFTARGIIRKPDEGKNAVGIQGLVEQ